MNERKTEKLVRTALDARGYLSAKEIAVEEQKSDNPKIRKLLKTASKAGGGVGSPEFIITSTKHADLVIIIECKANPSRHRSKELDKPKDYACDGALLYASYLAKEYDVIAIGVSGETTSELRINSFVHLQGQQASFEIGATDLISFDDLYAMYIQSPEKFNTDYTKLLEYSQTLNRTLHKLKVKESQRSLLISSILIALKNKAFVAAYKKHSSPRNLATNLVKTVTDELKDSDIPKERVANLSQAYAFIQTHTTLLNEPTALVDLISDVDQRVNGFMASHSYFDTLGQFYIEFLRYANNEKGLGIVLTPPHITELFAELVEVSKESVVVDNCCGTGGFLISAMKKMVFDCHGDSKKIERVKKTQLLGIEVQHDIYALAISNMILQDDGKSSVINGDCFALMDQMREKKRRSGC
jgi:type I restriction enzyme M protein